MARNGSGVYSLPGGYLAVTGETITATQHNTPLEDIGTEITASVPRAGTAAMTGNLDMGSNNIVAVTDPSSAQHAATKAYVDALAYLDADYGDITVSASGQTWTIDANAVTLAKMATQADDTILGNVSGGAAVPVALTGAQATSIIAPYVAPPGHIFGLTLSNGTDADHDIDVAIGNASSDDATFAALAMMDLTTAITKQIDAVWALGDAAGGLDTGAVAISTWYHVFLIQRSDTRVVDVLFSTSVASPTMPTNYDKQRRIGSVLTDGSANIVAFLQSGDEFVWDVWVENASLSAASATPANLTITAPLGVVTRWTGTTTIYDDSNNNAETGIMIYPVDITGAAASRNTTQASTRADSSNNDAIASSQIEVMTDTSSQISHVEWNETSVFTDVFFSITTLGWIDDRGRLS